MDDYRWDIFTDFCVGCGMSKQRSVLLRDLTCPGAPNVVAISHTLSMLRLIKLTGIKPPLNSLGEE